MGTNLSFAMFRLSKAIFCRRWHSFCNFARWRNSVGQPWTLGESWLLQPAQDKGCHGWALPDQIFLRYSCNRGAHEWRSLCDRADKFNARFQKFWSPYQLLFGLDVSVRVSSFQFLKTLLFGKNSVMLTFWEECELKSSLTFRWSVWQTYPVEMALLLQFTRRVNRCSSWLPLRVRKGWFSTVELICFAIGLTELAWLNWNYRAFSDTLNRLTSWTSQIFWSQHCHELYCRQ